MHTLLEINISHLGKRKIIFKYAIFGGYVSSLEGIFCFYNLFFHQGVFQSDEAWSPEDKLVSFPGVHCKFSGFFLSKKVTTLEQTNNLVGGFKYFLFSSLVGKIPILTNIFQVG